MTRPVFRTKPGQALELVDNWVHTPALRQLVDLFDGTWPDVPLPELLAYLEAFSAVWDRRSGNDSRLMFKELDESRDDELARKVYRAAEDLGLLYSAPTSMKRADHLLILGGLATGVEPRVRYAAELCQSGAVETSSVVALGSFRRLDERERPAAAHYATGARFEIELLSAMLAQVFDRQTAVYEELAGDPSIDPARAEQIRRFEGQPAITTYASRSSTPDERPANTADTYRQFAADAALRPADQLLIVTSSIYRPFQHLDAVRVLSSYGVEVETVGVPSTTGGPTHPPSAYLQEIRSTIRSAHALVGAIQAPEQIGLA